MATVVLCMYVCTYGTTMMGTGAGGGCPGWPGRWARAAGSLGIWITLFGADTLRWCSAVHT